MILSLKKYRLNSFPLFYSNELTIYKEIDDTLHFALIYNSTTFYVDFSVHTSLYPIQQALHEEVSVCC